MSGYFATINKTIRTLIIVIIRTHCINHYHYQGTLQQSLSLSGQTATFSFIVMISLLSGHTATSTKVVQKNAKFPMDSRLSANFPISREWKSVSRLFAIFLLSNFVEYHCILLARSQHYMRARQIYYYTATIWLDFSSESLLN